MTSRSIGALNKNPNELLTNDQGALNFLQDEASLVAEFGTLGPEHARQPVLSEHVIFHPQLKEVPENILHRLVLLQAADMIKQDLKKKKQNQLNLGDVVYPVSPERYVCGSHYHRVAREGTLKFEDFVEASSLGLPQLLLRHLDHKAHGRVGVVLLEVSDQRWNLLCAVQHGLQHILLIGLD